MRTALATAEQSVQLSVDRTEDLFVGAKAELENLSSTVALIDSLRFSSPEQCNRTLQKVVAAHERVKAIALLTPQGIAYCGSEAKAINLSFSERQYFKESSQSEGIAWGDLQISKVNNQITVVSARAVRYEGTISFVVLVTLDVASMKRQTFQQFQLPVAQAILMNGQGEILDKAVFDKEALPFDEQTLSQARLADTGIIIHGTQNKSSTLVGVMKLPMAAGRVIFSVPIGQIYTAAHREMVEVIALGCLETFLMAAVLLIALEFLVLRSLRQITSFASLITAGNHSQRVTTRSPFSEFAILSSTLNMMIDKLELASFTDALTGLANRRALEVHLDHCDESLESTGAGFSIAMIDIDHFKLFNDRFGHGTGDSVLQTVGKTLKTSVSGEEIAARYGGEEFTLVLLDTCAGSVLNRLEALRHSIEELHILHPDSRYGHVTVSIGFALVVSGGRAQEAIERADLALYAAKKRGRNRVASQGESLPELFDPSGRPIEDALS
ncbi:diguanylate cyclase [Pleomorphomonas sp. PLEO]|uniref:diguanylate cyclase n=1 Tax=Pleomorphomonas sp. PLEO TaxID=3239306 RepID=UPI00351EFAB0